MSKLSTAKQRITAMRGVKLLQLSDYSITDALSGLADTISDRIPSFTLAQVRAGEADTSPVVMITDPAIKGLFYYTAGSSATDDGTTTIVAGARRYIKDLTLNNSISTLQTQISGKQDVLGYPPVDASVPQDNPTYINSLPKAKVGLGNVDNTSDLNKPISTAVASALSAKQDALGFIPVNSGVAQNNPSYINTLAKSKVGLSNVDNTSDASKPVSTAQAAAIASAVSAKANSDSPTFTGVPLVPTPVAGNSSGQIANTAFVQGGFVDRTTSQIIDGAKSHSSPLKYTADLVSTYDARTLVDKGYVDAKIAAIPGGTGGTESSNYAVYGTNDAAYNALGANKKYKDLDDNIKETFVPYTLQVVSPANSTNYPNPTSPATRTWLGRQWKFQNANDMTGSNPWAVSKAVLSSSTYGLFRFELRRGDVWYQDTSNIQNSQPKERNEAMPNDGYSAPFNTAVWFKGMFKSEAGQDVIYNNEDFYTSIAQLHHGDFAGTTVKAGPCVAMDLSGQGTIKLFTRGYNGTVTSSTDTGGQLRCMTEVKREQWNWFVMKVVANVDGIGSQLRFWMNGKEICNIIGTSDKKMPIGYSMNGSNAFYPKFGIYRTWNDVTTAVWFANYAIVTGTGTGDDAPNFLANVATPDIIK